MAEFASDQENERRRGLVDQDTEPRFLVIGQVLKPHGIHGEVRVAIHTDLPERFTWLETVYVGETDPQLVAVENVRFHKNFVLLKFVEYDDRNAAETLRGQFLQVLESEAIPLQEGEYYLYQLQGLAVYTDEGRYLGQLTEVIETKANNVFVVRDKASQGEAPQKGVREILLPDIDEVVQEIDFDKGRMTVHLLPGLLE